MAFNNVTPVGKYILVYFSLPETKKHLLKSYKILESHAGSDGLPVVPALVAETPDAPSHDKFHPGDVVLLNSTGIGTEVNIDDILGDALDQYAFVPVDQIVGKLV